MILKVNINKLMKYPSQALEDMGTIDLFDDQDIETCIEEVMTVNEGADFEELPLDEPTGELITCNLNMIKHDYYCKIRHKTFHLCACYHTLSAFLSFYAILCYNLKIR